MPAGPQVGARLKTIDREVRTQTRRLGSALGTLRCGRLLSVSRVEPSAGDFLMRLTESIQEDSPHAKSGGLSLGPLRLRRVCLGLWGVESACCADQSTGYATVACTGHLPGIISSSC